MIDSAAEETSAPPSPCSARRDEPGVRRRQPVQQRREAEDRDAGEEQPAAPEQVTGAAAEQQEAAEHERIAVDHPLQVRGAEPEVGLDRRQRDVHHRRVEDDHELREADDDEDEPAAGLAGRRRLYDLDGAHANGDAAGGTRTPTSVRSIAPEAIVSTNSTTAARPQM
jgi:hypothetical protein